MVKTLQGKLKRPLCSSARLRKSMYVPDGRDHRKTPSRNKGAGRHHLLPHQHKHGATCRNQYCACIPYLTCLHEAPPPHTSEDLFFPIMSASVPELWVPSPRESVQTLPTHFPTCVLCGAGPQSQQQLRQPMEDQHAPC